MPPYTLEQLNGASAAEAERMLDGLYEHTPWIAREAVRRRPYASVLELKATMERVLDAASPQAQLDLIRAHPELAGKAMIAGELTAESTSDQSAAGLTSCTPEEFERIQQMNTDYNRKFGFPFILCVGAGSGMTKSLIMENFARRLEHEPEPERLEALRQIKRIVGLRLSDKFGVDLLRGAAATA